MRWILSLSSKNFEFSEKENPPIPGEPTPPPGTIPPFLPDDGIGIAQELDRFKHNASVLNTIHENLKKLNLEQPNSLKSLMEPLRPLENHHRGQHLLSGVFDKLAETLETT